MKHIFIYEKFIFIKVIYTFDLYLWIFKTPILNIEECVAWIPFNESIKS